MGQVELEVERMNRLNMIHRRASEAYEDANVCGIFDQYMILMPYIVLKDAIRNQKNVEASE